MANSQPQVERLDPKPLFRVRPAFAAATVGQSGCGRHVARASALTYGAHFLAGRNKRPHCTQLTAG
jgi:hypothetical protein